MLVLTIIFFALMFLGAPVAFAIGISGFIFFVTDAAMPMSIGVQKVATMSQSFPLLAVPFFVLAGHLMNESGITSRLFRFSSVAVGWMAGGLAQVAIVLSTVAINVRMRETRSLSNSRCALSASSRARSSAPMRR